MVRTFLKTRSFYCVDCEVSITLLPLNRDYCLVIVHWIHLDPLSDSISFCVNHEWRE